MVGGNRNAPSVLIVVFDGLQPAQVTNALMPNLAGFAAQGVTFTNHHPVYPTVTRANAASIVTGLTPGGHGIAANRLIVRDFDPHRVISALEPELAQVKGKTGQAVLAPTLADILARHGEEYVAIGVGTSGNAYLHNPNQAESGGATIHPDFTLPGDLQGELAERFGPWPEEERPNTPRMVHAVDIFTKYILEERRPRVALIWSSEPDKSQHDAGVGTALSNQAVKEADGQFGRLLGWLKESGRGRETDVMVVSDHGYSTINGTVDIDAELREAGFPQVEQPGGVAVAGNGGSALFYVHQRDPGTADNLAEWLMGRPWCGAMVASETVGEISGALPAFLVGAEGLRAPELAVSLRWNGTPNEDGYRGQVYSTGGLVGQGQHGSMSPHELHNVLFARGPSFKRRSRVVAPSGNTDVLPTVLKVLGIEAGDEMDGRVLEEALVGGPRVDRVDWSTELYNAERLLEGGVYRQQIQVSLVENAVYVDQGSSTLGRR